MAATRFPKLVAFDLDYTLWPLWIDTHVDGPLKRSGNALNEIVDRYDQKVCFYPDVPQILHRLRSTEVVIAACSRTSAPDLAMQALRLLLIPPKVGSPEDAPPIRAIYMFDQLEIYPGSKIHHFKQLHKKTGLPYSEMLFFDDEPRNREVEKLGVTFHLVTQKGVHDREFERGLSKWRERHPEEAES